MKESRLSPVPIDTMVAHDKGRELFFLAQDARQHGRHGEAESYLREALQHDPGRESVRTNLCGALIDQQKYVEALALCEAVVDDFPASAVGWHRLSICQLQTERAADAREHKIAILLRLSDTHAALQAGREAVHLFPASSSLHTALGVVCSARREFHDALECHRTALRLDAENPDKRWNLALVQLMLGDFAAGWQNMEARWAGSDAIRAEWLYAGSAPRWDGSLPVRDQKILVWAEQGLGDAIQFCRFIPQLVQVGAQVSFQVPGALLSLMRHNLPAVTVFGRGQTLPAHDFNLPLLSVARFADDASQPFPRPISIPAPMRLAAPEFHRKFWHDKLGERHKPRVGFMWQGNLKNLRGLHRSLELAELAQVLSLPLDFYCVSNTLSPQDADWLREHAPSMRSFTQHIKDFSDTAALTEQLDLLVTIDTSMAHLGGSLGVPTWILLAHSADWRWQTCDRHTPWYPESRLFRQKIAGDWKAPLGELAAALAERFGAA